MSKFGLVIIYVMLAFAAVGVVIMSASDGMNILGAVMALIGLGGGVGLFFLMDSGQKVDQQARSMFAVVALGAVVVFGLYGAARAEDTVYYIHALMAAGLAAVSLLALIPQMDGLMRKPVQNYALEEGALVGSKYNIKVVRYCLTAAMFWGLAGMAAGDLLAWQLAFPALNFDLSFINFGRLRPLHTSGVIFAFGGNVLIGTAFYVVQRTCRARLAGDWAPFFVFWGYNAFIVMAAVGYLIGGTQGKEYAEPVWYLDLWLTIVWVTFLLVFLVTLLKRTEPHIYVSNWYYLAFIITIAMLHLTNNAAVPVSIFSSHSYSAYAGVQDAMIQWWYGHNAVGFFLTAGFLGIMYYFIPKAANAPIYSYRLSVVGFWSLIFVYIWAGPHHLHYTALPVWTQVLGATFSIILFMPSWASAINGVMTLNGSWDKLRTDPVIRILVVAVAFYAMSTFEGPLMALRDVNSLSHYTDWTVGHVHSGALGWVAMVSFGAIYFLWPQLYGQKRLYSLRLVEWHFWFAMLGIVLYITAMWISGIMQGLMWRAYDQLGFLQYSFIETVAAMHPYYVIRAIGGLFFLLGFGLMIYNLYKTAQGEVREKETAASPIDGSMPAAAE